MIDTDKYEGHSTGWKHKINHSTYSIINDDGQKVASVPCYEECNKDSQLIADAPKLLAEVKRLRKLEAAVVGSWMQSCEHRGPWHKALRYPCVDLGYLVLEGHTFELAEEYQEMAKEWIRQKMVEIYGEDWDEER
tara:strand:- start:605 stop:1009 length:405 start_codon:yes stop_codon:yes gene_type:complete